MDCLDFKYSDVKKLSIFNLSGCHVLLLYPQGTEVRRVQ